MKQIEFSTTAFLMFALLMTSASCVGAQCDDPLARRFLPASLTEETGEINDVDCVVERVDLARSGSPEFLAVAYGNGVSGSFALIKGSGSEAAELFSMSRSGMLGRSPKIEMDDLDGDGIPEIIASWASSKDLRRNWVFRYHDGQLRSITPLETDDEEFGRFEEPSFVDFDGDGRKDAINRELIALRPPASEDEAPDPVFEESVYILTDNGFSSSPRNIAFFGLFSRVTGKPKSIEETFTFAGTERSRTLRVVNGGTSGDRTTSATITLNGAPIASPDDFKRKEAHFDVPVKLLEGENTLVVEVAGKPGSEIAVFIY